MKFFGLLIPPLILNINEKVCSNCVFYKKNDIVHGEHDYEGRCERFGEKNIVTGEIQYKLAYIRRQDNDLRKKKANFHTPSS